MAAPSVAADGASRWPVRRHLTSRTSRDRPLWYVRNPVDEVHQAYAHNACECRPRRTSAAVRRFHQDECLWVRHGAVRKVIAEDLSVDFNEYHRLRTAPPPPPPPPPPTNASADAPGDDDAESEPSPPTASEFTHLLRMHDARSGLCFGEGWRLDAVWAVDMELSSIETETMVLRWANMHLRESGVDAASNFDADWGDMRRYTALVSSVLASSDLQVHRGNFSLVSHNGFPTGGRCVTDVKYARLDVPHRRARHGRRTS